MVEKGIFLLKDISYTIIGSSVSVDKEGENIFLTLEVNAETKDSDIYYEMRSLRLYHNDGFCTHAAKAQALKGKKFVWESHYNENEEAAGFLCVQEHEEVTKSVIEILNISGNRMTVRWSGEANVFWDENYDEDVPFETVFEVKLPKTSYRINVYKSLSVNVDKDTRIELNKEDLEALNKELVLYGELKKKDWNTKLNIDTVLGFTVTHKGKEYAGKVTFLEGKIKHKTDFDDSCPIRVTFENFGWNFRIQEEAFWFIVE